MAEAEKNPLYHGTRALLTAGAQLQPAGDYGYFTPNLDAAIWCQRRLRPVDPRAGRLPEMLGVGVDTNPAPAGIDPPPSLMS